MAEGGAVGYLLDTNILSDLVRRPHGVVARQIAAVGEAKVGTSIVVSAELRFGAAKSGSSRLRKQVEAILGAIKIWDLASPVDDHYADIRRALERAGRPIGPNDLWIAAHARARGCVVVTANEREFARVPGLDVENWLQPDVSS